MAASTQAPGSVRRLNSATQSDRVSSSQNGPPENGARPNEEIAEASDLSHGGGSMHRLGQGCRDELRARVGKVLVV